MSNSPTVFVSHSHLDDAFGLRLIADLRARLGDDNVWYDTSGGLHGGDEWWAKIVRQITVREVFLVILSPNALASKYVRREMAMAYKLHMDKDKRLLPIRFQPCDLAADWDIIEWLPCREPQRDEAGYQQDVATILDDLLQWTSEQPLPPVSDWDTIGIHARLYDLGFRGWRVPKTGVEFILPPMCDVPAGLFRMGSTDSDINAEFDEKPQSYIPVNTYAIGKYPVTVAEYQCYLKANPCVAVPPGDDGDSWGWRQQQRHPDHPLDNILWVNAQDYAIWLTQITGQLWRLPTEAEWEKAARWDEVGQCARIFPWGNEWDKTCANTGESGLDHTTPIGSYPSGASPYGTQDMAGNVWEWCSSLYKRHYPYDPQAAEDVENRTDYRVLRGGSWQDEPEFVRASYRFKSDPTNWFESACGGFRLARS